MRKSQNFPPGWDERITVDTPDLWDPKQYTQFEKMAVVRGNAALVDIFKNTNSVLAELLFPYLI